MKRYEAVPTGNKNLELNCVEIVPYKPTRQQQHFKKDESFSAWFIFSVVSIVPVGMIYAWIYPYFEALGEIAFAPTLVMSIVAYYVSWKIFFKVFQIVILITFLSLNWLYDRKMHLAKLLVLSSVCLFVYARFI